MGGHVLTKPESFYAFLGGTVLHTSIIFYKDLLLAERQTDRHTGRQTDRQTDRQAHRHTDTQRGRQTGRLTSQGGGELVIGKPSPLELCSQKQPSMSMCA